MLLFLRTILSITIFLVFYSCKNEGALTSDYSDNTSPCFLYALSPSTDRGKIYAFKIDNTGQLTELTSCSTGDNPVKIKSSPDGKYLFSLNAGSNDITGFQITSTGCLDELADSPYSTGTNPAGMAFDPEGEFAYVTNKDDDSISAFRLTNTGDLTPLTGFSQPSGLASPSDISSVIIYSGDTKKFIFITNEDDETISRYNIEADGNLSYIDSLSAGESPDSIITNDSFIYLLNTQPGTLDTQNSVSGYSLSWSGTAYSFDTVSGLPLNLSLNPSGLALSPDNTFLYVARKDTSSLYGDIKILNVDTDGSVSSGPAGPDPGYNPSDVAIHPGGAYLYVSRDAGILVYSINQVDGSLSLLQTVNLNPSRVLSSLYLL